MDANTTTPEAAKKEDTPDKIKQPQTTATVAEAKAAEEVEDVPDPDEDDLDDLDGMCWHGYL